MKLVLGAVMFWGIVVSRCPAATADMLIVRPQATISGSQVTLSDIADLARMENDVQRRQLSTLVIGAAPLPGQARLIRDEYIRMRLRQQGVDLAHITFSGSSVVQVTAASQVVSAQMLVDAVRQYIYENMPWPLESVEVEAERLPRDITVAAGALTIAVSLNSTPTWRGTMLFTAMIQTERGTVTQPVSMVVRHFGEVMTATRVIERGQPLTAADVSSRREELTRYQEPVVESLAELVGTRARQRIAAHQIILPRQVEPIPLVYRRDMVQAVWESAGLRIVTRVQACEDGGHGDVIRVKNLVSQKELRAVVVNDSEVAVIP